MGQFDRINAAIKKMIPKKGFNVVGVDKWKMPGEELFLVANCKTRAEADAMAATKARSVDPDDLVFYVYAPDSVF